MKKKLLLAYEPIGAPEKICKDIKAVSRIIWDESSREDNIVEVDLYKDGELKARWFGSRKEWDCCTYVIGLGWKRMRIENILLIIEGKPPRNGAEFWYFAKSLDWYSNEDRERVEDELGQSVEYFESSIWDNRRRTALERKLDRINNLVNEIPTVPEDMEQWVREKVFPEEYLFMKKNGKSMKYSCTACGAKGWKKKGEKHNTEVACPKCGKKVIIKRLVGGITKKESVTLLQKMDKHRWAERMFTANMEADQDGKRIELWAEICAVIPEGKRWGKVYYGQGFNQDEFMQDWYDTNPINKRWRTSYLYPGNLSEVLPMGGLQNSGLQIVAEKGVKIDINDFIITFSDSRYVEYLIKSGFFGIIKDLYSNSESAWYAANVLNTRADTLHGLLGLDGNRMTRLRQMNGNSIMLEWLQYEYDLKGECTKISQETLEYLSNGRVHVGNTKNILKSIGSVNRMVNYLKKQDMKPKKALEIWSDYIRMAENEGLDVTDDIVRFPKELIRRHDELVEVIARRRDEERIRKEEEKYKNLNKKIESHLPEVKKYFYEDQQYMIIPAGKCQELMQESRELHHCVGASDIYMDKMAEGSSWIMFLRRKDDIAKAYYTLEVDIRNDKILQWRSEYNRQPDEKEIRELLDRYKKSIAVKRKKEAGLIAAVGA